MEFSHFYRNHFSTARRWVRNLGISPGDVDDVVQELFLVAMRQFENFDGKSERSWLFAITRRVCANFRRSRKRADARNKKGSTPLGPESPDQVTMLREAHRRMQTLLDALPEEQRLVFLLFEIEEMSANEVAQLLSIETKLVYSRLRGARNRIHRMIETFEKKSDTKGYGHAPVG